MKREIAHFRPPRKGLTLRQCAVLAFILGLSSCTSAPSRDAPGVERIARISAPETRAITVRDVLEWGDQVAPSTWVRTSRDTLPNGLAASMLPILVDWAASELDSKEPFVVVRNVNVGGNPVLGENLLATVKVPMDAVDSVQWCDVVTRNRSNRDTPSGHGIIRLLFDYERRPVVLAQDGSPSPLPWARLDDLVMSWEAWRDPRTRFDVMEGLDPKAYGLTFRIYSGAQRFLTDALRNSPWKCFPLRLPDTPDAERTVLMSGLLMGDALARGVLAEILDRPPDVDGEINFDALGGMEADAIAHLGGALSDARRPDGPLAKVTAGEKDISYNALKRSCITQSFMTLQLALNRIHAANDLGAAPVMKIVPDSIPDWAEDLAHADLGTYIYRAPHVVWFVMTHHEVIPEFAYEILEDAGLLVDSGDGPTSYYYHVESMTPYGHLKDNMM